MKRYISIFMIAVMMVIVSAPVRDAQAAVPILEIIKKLAIRVIKAIDLAIQRNQNKVIWLQNTQKQLENTMSKLKLDEITEWTEKHKEQYRKYFEELKKIKQLIAAYKRIREVIDKQAALVSEYRRAWGLLQNDGHFTQKELVYMAQVYSGILVESAKSIDRIDGIITAFTTSMTDGKRMELINAAADQVDRNYDDLRRFNAQNMMLSLQRARTTDEAAVIKQLYGLP